MNRTGDLQEHLAYEDRQTDRIAKVMGRIAFDDNTAYIWRSNRQTAEERLLIAVLDRAWMDATKPLYVASRSTKHKGKLILNIDTQEAIDWFLDDQITPFSFLWILDAVGMIGMRAPIQAQVRNIVENNSRLYATERP